MRTFAMGDIHGCRSALDRLLSELQLKPQDRLITLGDYIDRGPDSAGVLNRLIELRTKCDLIPLRGNHEMMMLAARSSYQALQFWLQCGGDAALESYGQQPWDEITIKDIPVAHWNFLRNECVDYFTQGNYIFVHANLNPDLELEDQVSEWLHWEFLKPSRHRGHCSGKVMVCGHSEQRNGFPLVLKQAICIDTWAYGEGWLTALCLDDLHYWQANELGELRQGTLTI
ncbi:MAG: serine/threonine protein phosphatase [Gemmataceae bacterium]|jgi:serine/threonine protein phosphatase 1|nr:serine/threonine protein phosphatase [Gemmataceae bacterium]